VLLGHCDRGELRNGEEHGEIEDVEVSKHTCPAPRWRSATAALPCVVTDAILIAEELVGFLPHARSQP
jgi:hypothetical protein